VVQLSHVPGSLNPADLATRPPTDGTVPTLPTKDSVRRAVVASKPFVYEPEDEESPPVHQTSTSTVTSDFKEPIIKMDLMAIDVDNYFNAEDIRRLQESDPKILAIKQTLVATPDNEVQKSLRQYHINGENLLYYSGVSSITEDNQRVLTPVP
ncbi:hypothetical protein FOZ62_022084, partial [Perkinsus olseni]